MKEAIKHNERSAKYSALHQLLDEQKKWHGGDISKASQKRATQAMQTLGLSADEIHDFLFCI